jgi:hypothetical protein
METKRSSEEGNKESEGRKLKILSMYEESFGGQDKPYSSVRTHQT